MGDRGLFDRSTPDLLILLLSVTICLAVLAAGAALTFLAVLQPQRDLRATIGQLSNIISVLVGLVAGFLAGRTRAPGAQGGTDTPPQG